MLVSNDFDDRIVTWAERGQHIRLTCKNHPTLRWSTKNIGGIGCRTIFYNLDMDRNMGPECSCSVSELVPIQE